MARNNRDWHRQVVEPVLEPELPICDPHHHLWDFPGSPYLLVDFLADIGGGHNVVSSVFVECGAGYRDHGPEHLRPIGEIEFVNDAVPVGGSACDKQPRVAAGIVGFADLTMGLALEEVLAAMTAAASGRFRGLRHGASWHASAVIRNSHTRPPENLLRMDAYQQGVELLGKLGLSFDAWSYHHQLPDLAELARSCPGTTMVLNHLGGPLGIGPYAGRAEQVFEQWREGVAALADCANVHCKLGGINMKINGYDWHQREQPPGSEELAEATQRYYLWAIEAFGVERCMFESNFPVDGDSCSYDVLWNSFKRMTASFAEPARRALFRDNAERFYRLS